MIKKTLYFGNEAYLSTKDEQMIVRFPEKERAVVQKPIEDIGVLVLDHYRLTYTHALMQKLIDNNVAVISCDAKHMPQAMFLNLEGNSLQTERTRIQLEASEPLKKNLWQQTIKAKILNQASVLQQENKDCKKMLYWAEHVNSGDPDNYEARAAAYYWNSLFAPYVDNFVRGRYEAYPNNLLNYGYAILRAVVARALVGSGLFLSLGIYHRNKYNAFCLADDIMEPYRPLVYRLVLDIVKEKHAESAGEHTLLDQESKKKLLQIPVIDVMMQEESSPLMMAMRQTSASLFHCMAGHQRKIKYPSFLKA